MLSHRKFLSMALLTKKKKKKKAQYESCELRFIWDKMRSIAQETVFQIAEKLLE